MFNFKIGKIQVSVSKADFKKMNFEVRVDIPIQEDTIILNIDTNSGEESLFKVSVEMIEGIPF